MEIETPTEWDNLWANSSVTMPTMRANVFSLTYHFFHADEKYHAVSLKDDTGLFGVLPLTHSESRLMGGTSRLCAPYWLFEGIMLDPTYSNEKSANLLLDLLREVPASRLVLENISYENSIWQSLRQAAQLRGMSCQTNFQVRHGVIAIEGNWESYLAKITRKRRSETQRGIRRLTENGELNLRVLNKPTRQEAAHWVYKGFELEHHGWKGVAGSSVIARGQLPYLMNQAELLADSGHLAMYFLEHSGVPIAFAYVPFGKGVLHVLKYAYDESYAKFGPGQILIYKILENAFHSPHIYKKVDLCGPLTNALKDWTTSSYAVGDMSIGLNRIGSAAIAANRHLKPALQKIRALSRQIVFRPKRNKIAVDDRPSVFS